MYMIRGHTKMVLKGSYKRWTANVFQALLSGNNKRLTKISLPLISNVMCAVNM